jgi:hypothetical protein
LADYAALDELLAKGLHRLTNKGTWKVWHCEGQEFLDVEAFRAHVRQHHISPELLHLLPKDDVTSLERPAETALRQRMLDLLDQLHTNSWPAQDEQQRAAGNSTSGTLQSRRGRGAHKVSAQHASSLLRDADCERICTMLNALEKEQWHLYRSLLRPIIIFVCEALPVRCAGLGSFGNAVVHQQQQQHRVQQ